MAGLGNGAGTTQQLTNSPILQLSNSPILQLTNSPILQLTNSPILIVVSCALLLIGAVPASGHHSFAAHYHEDQSISVEGDIVEFEYVNPHAWVHVEAADLSGRAQRVSAEWASPGRLKQQGITKATLKPGDRVILTGSPSRNESEYKMHLKAIERRADGWKWSGRERR